ncbi:TRAP transporter substrate-binding protein DctP [Roseivivax marinus]|jgi:TRAP-type C4-dicarboxylate transport system substrate-binding protein|uniref:TRAP transporter substrate-binding protein DctP n=1 Tax=Roseivivax marinus TaxID=1379903 RepID=UPI001F034B8C|nr:TRAP transporter substrate-binding protein DctP [Roseivivax marinus]UMA65346.1 TRAP transporter substrate-binding protein DctP [Roseivivax marinus]
MTRLSAILTASTILATAGAAQAADWTGYTYSSVSTTAAVQGMERITEEVAETTDGELDITLHLGKTLQIASSDITQAVGDGIVDFAADYFFSGSVPIARVLNLPMLINSEEEWATAYDAMEPYLREGFEEQGVVYLGGYRYPQQTIFTTFEIDDLSDLEGHKIRVTSPEQGQFIESFGGGAITLSGSEVPTSLERGVIEGVLTASAGGAKNWGEFLPYNYRFAVNYGNSVIIANADAFEALPEEQQEALRNIVSEEGPAITEAFMEDEQVQMDKQQSAGMTIVEEAEGDSDAALEQMQGYWTEWAEDKGPQYVEALQAVRDALGK